MERPTSVTVICWILIVIASLGVIGFLSTINMYRSNDQRFIELASKSPIPIPVQIAISGVGLGVMLTSGIAMLSGNNWGRWLYIVWNGISWIVGFATSPTTMLMLPGILLFLIVVFFLFRPVATEFFTESNADHEPIFS